jgi:hypothetical protein
VNEVDGTPAYVQPGGTTSSISMFMWRSSASPRPASDARGSESSRNVPLRPTVGTIAMPASSHVWDPSFHLWRFV